MAARLYYSTFSTLALASGVLVRDLRPAALSACGMDQRLALAACTRGTSIKHVPDGRLDMSSVFACPSCHGQDSPRVRVTQHDLVEPLSPLT